MNKFIFLVCLLLASYVVHAQDEEYEVDPLLVELKAKILSSADSSAVPYANIILSRSHSGTITNGEGYFSIELLNIDSLEVTSVGYERTILKIPPYYTGYEILTFYMKPVLYNVGEVTVEGEAKELDYFDHGQPTDIKTELRGDAFNEKPKVLQAAKSPGSYLYYKFSKSEKSKREVRAAMADEEKWTAFSKVYNKEVIMDLTGLNEAYADTFMLWFNAKNLLSYSANSYQVRASVMENFPLFKQAYKLE